jgi:hypothetical protein
LNGWLLVGAIAVLWAVGIFLMAFSLWRDRREAKRVERKVALAIREMAVGQDVVRLDEYREGGRR